MHFCSFASHILKIKPVTAANSIFLFCFLSMSCNKIKIKNSSCTDVLFFSFSFVRSIYWLLQRKRIPTQCLPAAHILFLAFVKTHNNVSVSLWVREREESDKWVWAKETERAMEVACCECETEFFSPFTLENPSARLVVINLISPHYKSYEII